VQDADGRVLLPLPHPSPRNLAWFKHNPWFDAHIVPTLRAALADAFA
jgi:uracil-DNA glycosylase